VALSSKVSLALVAAGSLALVPGISAAQNITVDGRFSPAQTLVGPNYSINANLGQQMGGNLFHSFGQFNLSNTPVPETATFTSTGSTGPISNVIGRVTGGNPSSIDGGIRSAITGANLYLINPSGIVFGPNATVNVSGSFHASTADYLKMSDGAKFQATNPDASTLSAAPPAAFGFLTARPAAITVNGSTLGPVPGTLGVVAGPVSITGATLSAPAGTIHVTSVAGTGEVPVDPRNTAASTVTSFGPVAVKGGSKLDVSDPSGLGSGGSVFIRSGALTIDASEINGDNYGSGSGGVLSLRGDNQITLSNGANVHAVAMSSGNGADVLLSTAPSGVILADAATVSTDTMASGNSGSITIIAGQLTLQNGTNVLAQSSGSGSGGDVIVSASGPLTINSGASLGTLAFADGNAGNVSVTATGPLTIDMSVGAVASIFQGIASQTQGTGNAGGVAVTAGTLSIVTNGEIESGTNASGNSGSVTVAVSGQLRIDGSGGIPVPAAGPTGIFSQAVGGNGAAGTLSVTTGALSIVNNGEISSGTFASGNAGTTTVVVSGQLTIDGSGAKPEAKAATGIFSQANFGSTGDAGIVNVSAGNLSVVNSGEIAANTFASGNAGRTTVAVSGQLTIDGSRENLAVGRTGIFSQTQSSGAAGTVSVNAGTLVIANDGVISSRTLGSGDGGSLVVRAGNLAIVRDGSIATDTRGPGSGNAGDVSVNVADRLTIDGVSQTAFTGISSRSTQGSDSNAGEVMVSARTLSIGNGGAISTEAEGQRSIASGGNIKLNVSDFLYLSSGEISTSVKGETGNGGDIAIDPQLVILNHSSIIAQAIKGHGGNITISADQFIPSSDSIVSATSQLGISGTVEILSPRVNVNGALVVLSSELRGRTEVLREACAARGDRPISSLVEAGRGGLPQDPEATLPALYIAGRDVSPNGQAGAGTAAATGTLQTAVRLTRRCG
jgi:filamentous hemagglutinin family protein